MIYKIDWERANSGDNLKLIKRSIYQISLLISRIKSFPFVFALDKLIDV